MLPLGVVGMLLLLLLGGAAARAGVVCCLSASPRCRCLAFGFFVVVVVCCLSFFSGCRCLAFGFLLFVVWLFLFAVCLLPLGVAV